MAVKTEMDLTEIRTTKDGTVGRFAGEKVAKWALKNIPSFQYVFCSFRVDRRAVSPADVKAKENQMAWYTFNLKIRL
jgi:hypothetical protein